MELIFSPDSRPVWSRREIIIIITIIRDIISADYVEIKIDK